MTYVVRAVVAGASEAGVRLLFHSHSRRKESEVSTPFFLFFFSMFLNTDSHLLYIFCNDQTLPRRPHRRRLYRGP